MAAQAGEDLAATLYADVHYYYGPPTAKPPHHRFDKGSYVYLFENASRRRARLQVANNAGTPDQDVFAGFLDNVYIDYSYKHASLVTLTIDGITGDSQESPTSQEWRLPTYDPRNEKKYLYKLHTVDLYFWTAADALLFVNATRRVLPNQQLSIRDEPAAPPSHSGEMSPVVQQLENVAITDPSYQQGRTRNSQPTSTSFPGPPMSAVPKPAEQPAFAPLAYNPAAPAAPEAIRHREKTPPPEDGAANPLVAAAVSDQGQSFGSSQQMSFPGPPSALSPPSALGPSQSQQQPQSSYFPGPPRTQSPYISGPQQSHPGSVPPPPPVGRTGTMPLNQQTGYAPQYAGYSNQPGAPGYQGGHMQNTGFQSPGFPGQHPLASPGFQQPMQSPGFQQPMQSPGFQQPMQSPGFQGGFSGPPQHTQSPPQHQQQLPGPPPGGPTPPPGGFSQYSYSQGHGAGQPPAVDYSVHQQVYRPTEAEGKVTYKPQKDPRGKLEDSAVKLEKGVTGFLKKLEKKYG